MTSNTINRRRSWRLSVSLTIGNLLLAGAAMAAEPVKSGLQPGEQIFAVFEPLNATGPFAGEQHCLVCENGANPVAMVFARSLSPAVASLLGKLDGATGRYHQHEMGSFAVFLSDDEELIPRLKETARKQSLKHTVLATDPPAGPDGFNVSKEADVTVVLYREYRVIANHAFRKGELNDHGIEKILADLPRLVQQK
jgi:hypothetical protein